MRSRRFDDARIAFLREVPVLAALDALGVYWKRDATFEPVKDKATVRIHVSLGGAVVELLATGPKWGARRIRKKSYAKVFRAIVAA